jgi:hypothetical protein
MPPRERRPSVSGYNAVGPDYEPLIERICRLAAHRGYDRQELMSPMLKRLMPVKRVANAPIAETADLRQRIRDAKLDGKTLAYLTESVETELDFARLRLT